MGFWTGRDDVVDADKLPRCAPQKGLPKVLEKKAKKLSRDEEEKQFRAEVWKRDKGRSRATGKPLAKSGTMEWSKLGEVDHAIRRSDDRTKIFDVSNALLLSKEENRLREVRCPRNPEFRMFDYEGPEDRSQPQTFTWRDADGKVIRTRIG